MGAFKRGQEKGAGPYTSNNAGLIRDRNTDDGGNPREPTRNLDMDKLDRPGHSQPLPKNARR